jgi:hypothetical protein
MVLVQVLQAQNCTTQPELNKLSELLEVGEIIVEFSSKEYRKVPYTG